VATPPTKRQQARERYERLREDLRSRIVSGELPSGAQLPSEHALAAHYGLSRMAVWRVLAELAAEGLIEKRPGRGSFATLPADPSQSGQTLQVAVYYPSAPLGILTRLVNAFRESHPLIRVQVFRYHEVGYAQTVTNLLESGQGPDLILLSGGQFTDMVASDYFLDLGDFLAERPKLVKDLYAAPLAMLRWQGRQYGVPLVFSPVVLCYNRQALARAGVPEPDATWTRDDLLEAAQRLTTPPGPDGHSEQYGFCFGFTRHRWTALLFAHGGALATPDGSRSLLAHPLSTEALQFQVDLAYRHRVSAPFFTNLSGEDLFLLRRAAMILTSYYAIDVREFSGAGTEWEVTLIPGAHRRAHLLLPDGMVVNQRSQNLRSALAFLDFLLSRQAQELVRQHSCQVPIRRSVAEAPQWFQPHLHPRYYHVYLNAMEENAGVQPFLSARSVDVVVGELCLAVAGFEPIVPACRRAEAALTAYLQERAARLTPGEARAQHEFSRLSERG